MVSFLLLCAQVLKGLDDVRECFRRGRVILPYFLRNTRDAIARHIGRCDEGGKTPPLSLLQLLRLLLCGRNYFDRARGEEDGFFFPVRSEAMVLCMRLLPHRPQ